MKFSIIMLHYDQYDELTRQAIPSIQWALDGYYDYEILICDDNSSEYEMVKALESDKIKVFQCPVRKNQSMSRNICLKAATGDVFFCADSDDYFHVKGLREACRFITENPDADVYPSKLIKPLREEKWKGLLWFVQNRYNPDDPYAGVYGNMQHAFSVDYIRNNGYYWDEKDYYWDSEDHYFNSVALGNAKKIVPINTDYTVGIHPLYVGSNSDRDASSNGKYSLYMLRMNADICRNITCPLTKAALDVYTTRFLERYMIYTRYKEAPDFVKHKIDKVIDDMGLYEVTNVRNHREY